VTRSNQGRLREIRMTIDIHKGYWPGCIGRITELHASYYSNLAGFGLPFEAKVAREMAEFCSRYEEGRDGLWLARSGDGRIQGSIAIDGVHAKEEGAHLRWFIADGQARGSGLGSRLLTSAMEFCDQCGYSRVYLWTFCGLDAARHLYEKFGFQLVQQQRGSQWGAEVEEQCFEFRP
jgi:GNAT superfamily N-acetyltransferase